MNGERLIELGALNALGALGDADRAEFLKQLANADAPTRTAVARLTDAVALTALAQSPARPVPAGLKSKIMAHVRAAAPEKTAKSATEFYNIFRGEGEWKTLPVPGVRVKDLAEDPKRGLSMKLYELVPGAHFPGHHHTGPEECFVVSGDFHVEGRVLHGGDFHHAEPDTDHGESFTVGGCRLLVAVATKDYK